jgi:uncharacterized membrane protein YdjX (TVP38/TMEM64 family)
MGNWLNDWIGQWIDQLGLTDAWILLVTVPLSLIQGFVGAFPFSTIIFIHVVTLGVRDGLLASWMSGTLSAIFVFWVCRSLFGERFNRKWGHKLNRYEKWQSAFNRYGVWAIIFLRTLPIMPNNLISFMSSISPIRMTTYIWSSIIGNLSHIWLFGILSASLIFPDTRIDLLIRSYIGFCLVLLAIFFIIRYRDHRSGRKNTGDRQPHGKRSV